MVQHAVPHRSGEKPDRDDAGDVRPVQPGRIRRVKASPRDRLDELGAGVNVVPPGWNEIREPHQHAAGGADMKDGSAGVREDDGVGVSQLMSCDADERGWYRRSGIGEGLISLDSGSPRLMTNQPSKPRVMVTGSYVGSHACSRSSRRAIGSSRSTISRGHRGASRTCRNSTHRTGTSPSSRRPSPIGPHGRRPPRARDRRGRTSRRTPTSGNPSTSRFATTRTTPARPANSSRRWATPAPRGSSSPAPAAYGEPPETQIPIRETCPDPINTAGRSSWWNTCCATAEEHRSADALRVRDHSI